MYRNQSALPKAAPTVNLKFTHLEFISTSERQQGTEFSIRNGYAQGQSYTGPGQSYTEAGVKAQGCYPAWNRWS